MSWWSQCEGNSRYCLMCNCYSSQRCIHQLCGLHCSDLNCRVHQYSIKQRQLTVNNYNKRFELCFQEWETRKVLENDNITEFSEITRYKLSIPDVLRVEKEVKLARYIKHLIQVLKPIKGFQTKRRNNICQEECKEYLQIFYLVENDLREHILLEEFQLFLQIEDHKNTLTSSILREMEEKTRKKKIITKKDKFFFDILTSIGYFVDLNNIIPFMKAFKIEDRHDFDPFVQIYKSCGFAKISTVFFAERYLTIDPRAKITQANVVNRYHLTQKDIENEPFTLQWQGRFRNGMYVRAYVERHIVALENKVVYEYLCQV